MLAENFDKNVFVNCPFDEEYQPILQAILFAIIFLGYNPRIAFERSDAGEARLSKIVELIEESQFSIHDLCRCISTKAGQLSRLNMPFELGIDYGYKVGRADAYSSKQFLVLDEEPYRVKAALSDFAGSDTEIHKGEYFRAIEKVRNWLPSLSDKRNPAPSAIVSAYVTDFQEWHYEEMMHAGYNENEIREYPTDKLLESMKEWDEAGRPVGSQN